MCYDVNFLTKKKIKYARRFAGSEADIEELEKQLEELGERIPAHYHVSGFDHPDVPVITAEPEGIQALNWGLIPNWIRDTSSAVELSNRTLNARSETMFDKPSFRESARERRCLVIVDGYFEHQWVNGKSYPYHIFLKNNEPMALGGLWDLWKDPVSGVYRKTFTIVTTRANPMMETIHNKPRGSEGPRMPLIIPRSMEEQWLMDHEEQTRNLIEEISQPYEEELMDAFTVPRLKGKQATGNVPEANKEHLYDELNSSQTELF